MLKKLTVVVSVLVFSLGWFWPGIVLAAGISASGGGKFNVGATFTVSVKASGATFDSLQGTISVSGPVQVVSFASGSATWLPGKSPANGNQFVGIVSATSSLTVATIKLKGTKEGSGSVSVSGVRLARSGAQVGDESGGTSFTIVRAPTPPGSVKLNSATHPDQNQAYETTVAEFTWERPSGVTGFSFLIDQAAETTPPAKVTGDYLNAKYDNLAIGTHYFHLRAINADGWGPASHYKLTIKEPDPKITEGLVAPTITSIGKTEGFVSDVVGGTLTGIVITGAVPIEYQARLIFDPNRLPEGVNLLAPVSTDGLWQIVIDKPVPAGFYKLTVQGQKDKSLTPVSQPVTVELSVANGATVKIITTEDLPKPPTLVIDRSVKVLGVKFKDQSQLWLIVGLLIFFVVCLSGATFLIIRAIRRRLPKPTKAQVAPKPNQKFWNS